MRNLSKFIIQQSISKDYLPNILSTHAFNDSCFLQAKHVKDDYINLSIVTPSFTCYSMNTNSELACHKFDNKNGPDDLVQTFLLLLLLSIIQKNRHAYANELVFIANRLKPIRDHFIKTECNFWYFFYIKEFISSFLSYKHSPENYYFWNENKESAIKNFIEGFFLNNITCCADIFDYLLEPDKTYFTSKNAHLLFIPINNLKYLEPKDASRRGVKNTCIPLIYDTSLSWKDNLVYKVNKDFTVTIEAGKKWSGMSPTNYCKDTQFIIMSKKNLFENNPLSFNLNLGTSDLHLPTLRDSLDLNIYSNTHYNSLLKEGFSENDVLLPGMHLNIAYELWFLLADLLEFFIISDESKLQNNSFHNILTHQLLLTDPFLKSILPNDELTRRHTSNLLYKIKHNSTGEYNYLHNEVVLPLFSSFSGCLKNKPFLDLNKIEPYKIETLTYY